MGLFSGIIDAISGGSSGGIIPAVIGGVSSLLGQQSANDTNVDIANQNNATSIELANTAYQRKVKDLTAAGLNPALAYINGSGGGASGAAVPNLQQARVENSASSATQGALSAMQQSLIGSQIATQQSQADLNSATAAKVRAETPGSVASSGQRQLDLDIATANKIDKIFTNQKILEADRGEAITRSLKASNDWNTINYLNDYASANGFRNFEEGMKSLDFRNKFQANYLQSNEIPKSDAEAAKASTAFGKYVSPYIGDAKSLSSIVAPILH